MRGSRAAAPKGTKSCRTQGDFCLSSRLSVHPCVPPGPLRPVICPLRPEIYPLRPERADFRPERAWGGQMNEPTDEQTDKQKSPCVLQDFVPFGAAAQKADFGPERAWGRRMDKQTNRSHPVFYRTSSPSGPLPKKLKNAKK